MAVKKGARRAKPAGVGPMKNPPHPGDVVRRECIEPLELTMKAAAAALQITPKTLSMLCNGHQGISAEMAIRLEKAFGGTAEAWLRMQATYDLAQARLAAGKLHIRRVPPAA
jgi:addiction module HigA family antidote